MHMSNVITVNKGSIFVFFTFCGLITTVFSADLSENSNLNKNINGSTNISKLSDIVMNEYVGTTHRIDTPQTKAPSRYEQGLEDYDEAVARVENMKEEQRSSNNLGQITSLFGALNTAWSNTAQNFKRSRKIDGDANSEDKSIDSESTSLSTDVKELDQSEGRYIKGDPLKGYYDFIITEGSYKFWAAFQLFTALLMIYSTFAAIYYSKVNPIVSDYDYINYLGGGRSMADDPEPSEAHSSALPSLLNSHWLQTAAHGFEFVLNAIDRLPQSS